nr:hypothetical protein [Micromonospora sp. DSM 115978]
MKLAGRHSLIALAVIATLLASSGCDSGSTNAEPDPGPRYEQAPRDLCEHGDTAGIANRYGLQIDDARTQTGQYLELRAYWEARCNLAGTPRDGRFALAPTHPFNPKAQTDLRVYSEISVAERDFDMHAEFFRSRSETEGPHLTATARAGWWDESLALISRKDPEPRLAQRPGAITLFDIRYVIRHDNLIVMSSVLASSPTSEADEAMTFLDDLLNALMEEHVSHLVRSG